MASSRPHRGQAWGGGGRGSSAQGVSGRPWRRSSDELPMAFEEAWGKDRGLEVPLEAGVGGPWSEPCAEELRGRATLRWRVRPSSGSPPPKIFQPVLLWRKERRLLRVDSLELCSRYL